MQKKTAGLIMLIAMSVFVVLSFIPGIFSMSYWQEEEYGYGATKSWTIGTSLYTRYVWLAVIILLFAIAAIVVSVFLTMGREMNFLKIGVFAPAATAVVFAIFSTMVVWSPVWLGDYDGFKMTSHYEYWFSWGFYIECVLLLTATVFGILIALGKTQNNVVPVAPAAPSPNAAPAAPATPSPNAAPAAPSPNAAPAAPAPVQNSAAPPLSAASVDELRKYKELLDSGIITQEEFDGVKKRILGF